MVKKNRGAASPRTREGAIVNFHEAARLENDIRNLNFRWDIGRFGKLASADQEDTYL